MDSKNSCASTLDLEKAFSCSPQQALPPPKLFPDHHSTSLTTEECPSMQSYFARTVFHCWELSFLFYNTVLVNLWGTQILLVFPTPYSSGDKFRNLLSTQQSPSAVNSKSFGGGAPGSCGFLAFCSRGNN